MSVPRPGKNLVLAYVLWFFFGTLGAHRYYVGHVKKGLLFLVGTVVAIAIAPFGFPIGFVSLALGLVIFVFWIIDAFKLRALVAAAGEAPSKTNE